MAVNGRPWFVRFSNSAAGLTGIHTGEVGPFDVPFQPSNEAEQLFLQSDPLEYKSFATEAQAEAFINSPAGKKDAEIGSGPAGAVQAAGTAAASSLGIPTFTNTRDLVTRTVKVLIGVAMIIVGLVEIAKPGQVLSKLPLPV